MTFLNIALYPGRATLPDQAFVATRSQLFTAVLERVPSIRSQHSGVDLPEGPNPLLPPPPSPTPEPLNPEVDEPPEPVDPAPIREPGAPPPAVG